MKLSEISYYWPRFSDLCEAVGVIPQEWQRKIPETELFEDYAKVCLHWSKIPTKHELTIATRELRTRTHAVRSLSGADRTDFHHRFRAWLENQSDELRKIIEFPGWSRRTVSTKSENELIPSAARQHPFYFHPFLPACLQSLELLARGEAPDNEDRGKSPAVLFEQRCADAFRCLGFEIQPLGQGKGRAADFLAKAPRERMALIVDAKVRAEGYVLGTEDRKFLEYANTHSRSLRAEGFESIYLVIVAASFRQRDLDQLAGYLTDSLIRSVALITARALMRLVEQSIRERHAFGLDQIDKQLFGNRIISS